ncbi:MAG: aminopeptidase P N-terminal domain-containing protein [Gammaproteobacteria bacterium]|nr:aminopeptidase P N-terminal domain-containing protein [Gammaproteobacteria bacterium]
MNVHKLRRQKLARKLTKHSVAIIPTAPEVVRSRDTLYPYRPDSYFYYLSGFREPNAYLLIDHTGFTTLWCQPKDMEREIWDGQRLGPNEACQQLQVDRTYSIDEINQTLPPLLLTKKQLWYPSTQAMKQQIYQWCNEATKLNVANGQICPSIEANLCDILDEFRLIKDASELRIMQKAADISAQAHLAAMRLCSLSVNQKLYEYQLEAKILSTFYSHGSKFPAYNSIVAAGKNACILHYVENNATVSPKELVLIDAGCEFQGYASDITRTFPACGKFSSVQKEVYELVLNAQEAAINAIHPGAPFTAPHQAALQVLAHGLLELGILQKNKHGNASDVIANKTYLPFYMHRTSHWLGMDVHDCGSYISHATDINGSQPRALQVGMVLTVEPGLYLRPSAEVPEKYWNIGIRIEDDVVVTKTSHRILTRKVPVDIESIEQWMQS